MCRMSLSLYFGGGEGEGEGRGYGYLFPGKINAGPEFSPECNGRLLEKMTAGGTAIQAKIWGDKPAGEEGLKIVTVECLRGRLLAERTASRNAKQEAEQIEIKLAELEKSLKEETKSRNRAEKRLKSLMKKMKSSNLSYPFDECEIISSTEISSQSSSSSVISSRNNQTSEITANFSDSTISDVTESKSNNKQALNNPPVEIQPAESVETASDGYGLTGWMKEEEVDCVDNSLALVVVEMGKKKQATIDPEILDANVKQVMDVLRHAKEKLQTSMDNRRRLILKVG